MPGELEADHQLATVRASQDPIVGILGGADLKHKVSPDIGDGGDFIVKDQYPKAGEEIEKTGTVYLYRK